MEKTAGKQSHLLEHLTLITPVGVLTQPFVIKGILTRITMQGEGKGRKLRILNKKWVTCTVTASKLGRPGEGAVSVSLVLQLSTCPKIGVKVAIIQSGSYDACRTGQDGFKLNFRNP